MKMSVTEHLWKIVTMENQEIGLSKSTDGPCWFQLSDRQKKLSKVKFGTYCMNYELDCDS